MEEIIISEVLKIVFFLQRNIFSKQLAGLPFWDGAGIANIGTKRDAQFIQIVSAWNCNTSQEQARFCAKGDVQSSFE